MADGVTMSSRQSPHPRLAFVLRLAVCLFTAAAATGPIAIVHAQPAVSQAKAGTPARTAARDLPDAPAAPICTSAARKYRRLASRMSRGITAALRGRVSVVGLTAADARTHITCKLHPWWTFHSASVVKVIILGALLHELEAEHRALTPEEVTLTQAMITQSSNSAATALWDEVGMRNLQRFLNLAKMKHTQLGEDGFWGLTLVTAHDELLLLNLLTTKNSVLRGPSRAYALHLMAHVIPSQRWGVPAGAPAKVTVHVKNGWLPDTGGWVINSIGAFTGHGRDYKIVVLTRDNPSMTYGVDTVQGVAEVINRDLNPGVTAVIPPSEPYPSWGIPDEQIPALPGRP
jgi:beta-lactamase class A